MILLTGGTGFLGRHILRVLLENGRKVRVLTRRLSKANFGDNPAVEVMEGDLLDPAILEKAVEGTESVIHCAAKVSFWKKQRPEMFASNVTGTANLVNACLNAHNPRFVYISSIAALGRPENGAVLDETARWKESKYNSYYGRTKYLAELEVYRGVQEGLRAVIANPGVIIGPGDWRRSSAKLIKAIWNGLKFYRGGTTGFVGADDVARAVALLEASERSQGERFVLVGTNETFKKFFEMVAAELGRPAPSIKAPVFLAKIAGTLNEWLAGFTGKTPMITRETIRTAGATFEYDGSKITREFDFQYTPLDKIVEETAKVFLAERH